MSWSRHAPLLAFALSLPGCDVDGYPSLDEPEEEAPISHEGEDCDGFTSEPQECSDEDEVRGVELCVDWTWSRCFVEPCASEGETRTCSTTKERMIERCVPIRGHGLVWGACAEDACEPGEQRDCEAEPTDGGTPFYLCTVDDLGVASIDPTDCDRDAATTPLVLSFAGEEPTFHQPLAAADFDVNGRGICTSPGWPTAATPWLARDLDHSGSIEGGHELFGNGTRLGSGRYAKHGFEALAELDSDGDGVISRGDDLWPELLLWADVDGDRVSDGWELLPLASYGVDSLSLDVVVDPRCDGAGNCSRERAAFTVADELSTPADAQSMSQPRGQLIDVYLACP